jgi:hypothetical protein
MGVKFNPEDYPFVKDSALIHNHPNDSPISARDVGFGIRNDAHALYVVCSDRIYEERTL